MFLKNKMDDSNCLFVIKPDPQLEQRVMIKADVHYMQRKYAHSAGLVERRTPYFHNVPGLSPTGTFTACHTLLYFLSTSLLYSV